MCGYGLNVPAWLRGPITGLYDDSPLLGVFRWFRWMLPGGVDVYPSSATLPVSEKTNQWESKMNAYTETTQTLETGETIRLISSVRDFDATERNEQRRWMKGDSSEGCTMCGRRIGKNDLYVFHVYGCEAVHVEDVKTVMDSDPLASWVGWYRIGSGCASKLPKGYAFTVAQYNRLNRDRRG